MIKKKFDHYYRTTKGEKKLKNAIMSQKRFNLLRMLSFPRNIGNYIIS